MSNDIARFETPQNRDGKPLDLTAFVGGDKMGKAVQLTINGEYAILSEQQVSALAELLQARRDGKITATEPGWSKLTIGLEETENAREADK